MNQVDFFIIVILLLSALSGARRGIVSSAGDIISLVLGLILGALAYPLAAAPVRWIFAPPDPIAGALGFLIVAILTVILAGWGFSFLARRFELSKLTNRLGGAVFGVLFGSLLAAVLVLASGILPGAAPPISKSTLGPRIIALVPHLHENMESLGVPLPKLVRLPDDYRDELRGMNRGLQFLRLNFLRLDGATCINCRSPVDFTGYHFSHGTIMSPQFVCPNCGRTSDGCQTFQGFHRIYGVCPVPLARQGILFDCGVWTNGWWTVPNGPCPVCGKEYRQPPDTLAGPAFRARASPVPPDYRSSERSWRKSNTPSSVHHSPKVARRSPAYS
ncbi:MAG: CvpA family protein [Armatimonadota bacterium]|nr:MAG: CvpA family protein [Armatimonadota bacterium]